MTLRARGLTLIEMLVTCSVMGILLTLIYNIVTPCLHNWNVNQNRAAIEQGGVVLQNRLQRELQQAPRQSINFTQPRLPVVIGFMTTDQDGTSNPVYCVGSGLPLWQRYVLYYEAALSGPNEIWRKVWPNYTGSDSLALGANFSFPTFKPVPLTGPQLLQLADSRNGTEQRVGSNVTSMTAQTSGSYEIDIQIELQIPTEDGPQYSVRNFNLETRL